MPTFIRRYKISWWIEVQNFKNFKIDRYHYYNTIILIVHTKTYCYLRAKNSDSYNDLVDLEMASEDETD